jgi:putative membrane protein
MHDPRVFYAVERTLLAWIRTGLAMMGFGFVVARFGLLLRELAHARSGEVPATPGQSLWFGTALIVGGVIVLSTAVAFYCRDIGRIRRGEVLPAKLNLLAVSLGVFLAALGMGMAAYLVWWLPS